MQLFPAVAVVVVIGSVVAQEWRETSPGARQGFPCCYDPRRGVTVVFGGSSGASSTVAGLRDTWEWDGAQWNKRTPTAAPPGRENAAMAWDPVRGVCLMFGGRH